MKLHPYDSYQSLNIEWNQLAPAHWCPSRLKFDSYIKARVGWHGLKSDEFTEHGPYLITGSDFSGKIIDWSNCYHCDVERYEQDPYIQLKDDDLLITKDGTIGKVILTGKLPDKATLNSGVFVLRPLKKRYDTKYYYWLMQSTVFHGFVEYYRTGSTIAHLYQETFCNLPYALPPIDEQTQIAVFLDRETAKIDLLIEKQQRLIGLLEEKRQAIISHAVTKGLNPDAPMKDSGIEWLGEVQSNWQISKVKHHARVKGRIGFRGYTVNDLVEEKSGAIVLGAAEIHENGQINLGKVKYISWDKYFESPEIMLEEGMIIVVQRGSVGKVALIPKDLGEATINPSLVVLKEIDINSKFLALSLMSHNIQSLVKLQTSSTAVPMISQEQIGNYWILIPPMEEQLQIVSYIENECWNIDLAQQKVQKSIELLKERRIALISAAVTGKIDVRESPVGQASETANVALAEQASL